MSKVPTPLHKRTAANALQSQCKCNADAGTKQRRSDSDAATLPKVIYQISPPPCKSLLLGESHNCVLRSEIISTKPRRPRRPRRSPPQRRGEYNSPTEASSAGSSDYGNYPTDRGQAPRGREELQQELMYQWKPLLMLLVTALTVFHEHLAPGLQTGQ